jgi:Zn finger protein HypA/HybF involved in hydrogenase expression
MKAATINEIKQELSHQPANKVVELCLRLGRFKKENKELLTFLLFEAHNIPEFIESSKMEIETEFEAINTTSVYFVKKSLRKILRIVNKYCRYSGLATVEIELLIYFCEKVNELKSSFKTNPVIFNIYQAQLKKITKALASLHEDLQFDYQKQIDKL